MATHEDFNDLTDKMIMAGATDQELYHDLSKFMDVFGVPMYSYARYRHRATVKRLFNERGVSDAPHESNVWVTRKGSSVEAVILALYQHESAAIADAARLNKTDPDGDWHAEMWLVQNKAR